MDTIDITYELKDFYHHLNEATIDRTIFSARFGDGKTEFLKQFKEKYQNEYDFYTLYPVNYQIAPNEQIMEYIKRDLLFQLILNNKIEQGIEIPDSIAFQWYLCNNSFDIIRECMKFAPSLIGTMAQYQMVLEGVTVLAEAIIKQYQKFKDYEKEFNNDESKKALNFVGKFNNEVGGIYELDPISWLIAKSITDEKGKKSVLIIEDPQFRSIILCDLLLYIDVTFWYLSIDLGFFWGSWFLHRHNPPHTNPMGDMIATKKYCLFKEYFRVVCFICIQV